MEITETSLRKQGFADFEPYQPYNKLGYTYLRKEVSIGWIYVICDGSNDNKGMDITSLFYKKRFRNITDTSECVNPLKRDLKKMNGESSARFIKDLIEELTSYDISDNA